jgi:hypothetical protein
MNVLYRIALLSGLIPLSLGVGIFGLWLLTRSSWLEVAGLMNLGLGLVLFVAGIVCWIVYVVKVRREGSRFRLRMLVPLLVLLVNFPAAFAIVYTVDYINSTSTLIVENRSSQEISGLRLSERDRVYSVGSVPAGGRIKRGFHFVFEGSVTYAFERDGKTFEGVAFGYVTSGVGYTSKMVINEPGDVTLAEGT